MADFNNIPLALKITSQIPLDIKRFSKDEETLSYLGVNNNLAFTYYDSLKVFCKAERTTYEWREVQSGEENTGLVSLDFTYPNNLVVSDVVYSNKKYNFFKVNSNIEDIEQSLISVGNGVDVYKGYNNVSNKHEIKTLTSNNNSVIITETANTINFEINPLWIEQYLNTNSNVICTITNNCGGEVPNYVGNFGYSELSTACGSGTFVLIYRDVVNGLFETATKLATNSELTNFAPAGYYSELSSSYGAIISRYWNGSTFVGAPEVCSN